MCSSEKISTIDHEHKKFSRVAREFSARHIPSSNMNSYVTCIPVEMRIPLNADKKIIKK